MIKSITQGVKIEVETNFRSDISRVNNSIYFFNYDITISNTNEFDVQLLSRCWYIYDSLNQPREIKGPGVVGETPILKFDESHEYTSGCDLSSEIGYMEGYFIFKNMETRQLFKVEIPRFHLVFPFKMN